MGINVFFNDLSANYSLNRYLKSTIGNISLIDRFRKKEESEASPEQQVFQFWVEYFVEATKTEVGDCIRFPVRMRNFL